MAMLNRNGKNVKGRISGMRVDDDWLLERMSSILSGGKKDFDSCLYEVGRELAEVFMHSEREVLSGPWYHPENSEYQKWSTQKGSVYVGEEKMRVDRPRLRKNKKEVSLESYESLQDKAVFSEELLTKMLRGLSGRKYKETVSSFGDQLGMSPSSVSKNIVETTSKRIRKLKERDLSEEPLYFRAVWN